MSYRVGWGGGGNKMYGWEDLVADIEAATGTLVPRRRLEAFVRGIRKGQSGGSAGEQRYAIPEPDRVEGIIRFLSDPDSDGYFCDRSQLLAPIKLQAPFFLQESFGRVNDAESYFEASLPESEAINYLCDESVLHLMVLIGNRARLIDLVDHPGEDKDPEIYSGWLAFSPEELGLIALQHERTGANRVCFVLGVDALIYEGDPPRSLVLLEADYPVDTKSTATLAQARSLSNHVTGGLPARMKLFTRGLDSSETDSL
ncbi:MAG: hypothetical protein AAF515_16765 [Pseudomonadota bacterium]